MVTPVPLAAVGTWSLATKLHLAGEVLTTYARVRVLMSRNTLPETLDRIRGGRASVEPTDPAVGLRLARATRLVLRVLPADTRCLMQSLVL